MSTKYPGGFITKDYVAPTPSAAPGVWTLDQQMQAQKTGTWPFGGPFNYIEDVFSTYLYTGTGAAQTITNGIDLSTKGGLVWIKDRTQAFTNALFDTTRGAGNVIRSNGTNANFYDASTLTAFNSNGFSVGTDSLGWVNTVSDNYASWTFREQPKFFDVVTYTGDGTSPRTVAHNLGSAPGMMFIKRTDSTSNWSVNANYLTSNEYLNLNTTAGKVSDSTYWAGTRPSSTVFTLGTNSEVNASGGTYVAYLFAHNAGGFGATGTDNVISCGSYTGTGAAGNPITLGYEPQFLIIKKTDSASAWYMQDTMRQMSVTDLFYLTANDSASETDIGTPIVYPTATGFTFGAGSNGWNGSGGNYIYIAIRRGPMKVPTDATTVYTSASRTGTAGVIPRWTAGFPVDWALRKSDVTTGGGNWQAGDRLRGAVQVKPNLTEAESSASPLYIFDSMTGYASLGVAGSDTADRSWMFRRAPGFFDEVCYTGTGSATTVAHNLGAVPELMIVKSRSATFGWQVYSSTLGSSDALSLNTTAATNSPIAGWNYTTPTSTVFSLGFSNGTNQSTGTFVNYLFATCPGVSKVGSYTGTGATQTIACGFAAGARFVLIKRTDSTGDWYVWDSARGMVSGTDPSLLLNSTAAEVNANSIYAITTGFQIVSTAAGINASGGSYIFLAVA